MLDGGSCASVHLRDPCTTLSVVRATNDLCCLRVAGEACSVAQAVYEFLGSGDFVSASQ